MQRWTVASLTSPPQCSTDSLCRRRHALPHRRLAAARRQRSARGAHKASDGVDVVVGGQAHAARDAPPLTGGSVVQSQMLFESGSGVVSSGWSCANCICGHMSHRSPSRVSSRERLYKMHCVLVRKTLTRIETVQRNSPAVGQHWRSQ